MNPYVDLLYARPSFWEGAARTLDLGSTLNEYNASLTEEQADYLAEQADWNAVGDDLRDALAAYAETYPR